MPVAWLLAACFFWLARPGPTSLVVGGALVLAGLGIRAWAAGVLEKDRKLAVSGPYAFTRNPLYFGSFVVGTGAAAAGGVFWFFPLVALFFAWVYGETMKQEASDMEARFGDDYARYRHAVPLFIPSPTPYRGSGVGSTSFSFERYVRNREYEAAAGALAAFGVLASKLAGWWG